MIDKAPSAVVAGLFLALAVLALVELATSRYRVYGVLVGACVGEGRYTSWECRPAGTQGRERRAASWRRCGSAAAAATCARAHSRLAPQQPDPAAPAPRPRSARRRIRTARRLRAGARRRSQHGVVGAERRGARHRARQQCCCARLLVRELTGVHCRQEGPSLAACSHWDRSGFTRTARAVSWRGCCGARRPGEAHNPQTLPPLGTATRGPPAAPPTPSPGSA